MPYIGVSPQFGVRRKHTYTATAGQTSFSGAGSEGATLSYTDSNFVDVYQNGVKLGDADYTSTSGTAIVLAQGASVDDLVEIIVFDAFSAADTVSKADGGQFDNDIKIDGTLTVVDDVSVEGSTPTLTLADTDVSNNKAELNYDEFLTIDLDPNNARGNTGLIVKGDGSERFRLDSSGRAMLGTTTEGNTSADNLTVADTGHAGITIRAGSSNSSSVYFSDATTGAAEYSGFLDYAHGTDKLSIGVNQSTKLAIDSTGAVTKPFQPAFQAKIQTGGQDSFAHNVATTLIFSTEVFDQNADFNTSTYIFTAPVTGKYQLQLNVLVVYLDYNAGYYQTYLQTSNQTFYSTIDPDMGGKNFTYYNLNSSVITDMDANDTAVAKILQSGGTSGNSDIDASSTFSGVLIC